MFESMDFSAYLDSALLADVEVSIIVATPAELAPPHHHGAAGDAPITTPRSHPFEGQAAATLPGHRLVLHAASPLFAQHIERWERGLRESAGAAGAALMPGPGDTPRPVRAKIQLLVNSDADAEAAQMLYRAIYSGAKALEGATHSQLLAVTRLAHGFGVARSAELAARMLSEAASEQLSWSTVEDVFALPDACRQWPAFAGILAAAEERLHQELGDLDAAMQDAQARGRLMALPLPTLCALLRDPRTRASCEATALAVASAWFADPAAAELRQRPGVGEQQAAALVDCVRFGRLQPAVLAAVAPRTEWVAIAVGLQQLLDLTAFAAAGADGQRVLLEDRNGLVASHPQWFLPPRPPSSVREAAWAFEVTAEELRVATGKARNKVKPGGRVYLRPCAPLFFLGFSWRPQLEVKLCAEGGVTYGMYIHCVDDKLFTPAHGQNVPAVITMTAAAGAGAGGAAGVALSSSVAPRVGWGRGWGDSFQLGQQAGWSPEAWEEKGLLGEQGVVRVNIAIRLPADT